MYSDNFRTFKRVRRDLTLDRLSQHPQVSGFLTGRRLSWKFIVERAAWWGGFWERLIRTVKTCLRKILGRSTLGYEDLATILAEIEAVMNSRPLTYVSEDPNDFAAITPSHFLVGHRLTALPSREPRAATGSTPVDLRRRWIYQERLTDRLWEKWTKEYILSLRSANTCKPVQSRSVKVGDLVLISAEQRPRISWPLGRVSQVRVSPDGRIRSCEVTLPGGRTLNRPVQLLYRLEADS
ncbi:uncharacterized protein LOC135373131 [Ornithodoros turicata]|uniref:uncharacterized protein LOC135373131 n=1 Tax=Ornithodoros turicata TaxID=34597 RepID=UPI00313A1E7B